MIHNLLFCLGLGKNKHVVSVKNYSYSSSPQKNHINFQVPNQNTDIKTGTDFLPTLKAFLFDLPLKARLRGAHPWDPVFIYNISFAGVTSTIENSPFWNACKEWNDLNPSIWWQPCCHHSFSWLELCCPETNLSLRKLTTLHPSSIELPLPVKLSIFPLLKSFVLLVPSFVLF